MKHYKNVLIVLFVLIAFGAESKNLKAYLLHSTFNSPQDGPYIETYLSIDGNSLVYKEIEPGKFQGAVEVTMMFKEDDAILNFEKYELLSSVIEDTTFINKNFLDIKRFALPNGTFSFDLIISDKNANSKPLYASQKITIDYPQDIAKISGFQLLEDYEKSEIENSATKHGYNLIPKVSAFFGQNEDEIAFYNEIYNLDKKLGSGTNCIAKTYVTAFNSGIPMNEFGSIRKIKAANINPLLNTINIEKLPSGNYYLIMELIDKENTIVASKKIFFQRSNPSIQLTADYYRNLIIENSFVDGIKTVDSLKYSLNSLIPIADQLEISFINKLLANNNDEHLMRKYLYAFWEKRDNIDPNTAWLNYAAEVRKTEEAFGTGHKHGFETDRGRLYLRYGPPNTVIEELNDPHSYPYIMWHYYQIGSQRNRKFVFYANNAGSNNFELLHSNAVGFVNNPKWKRLLIKRTMGSDLSQEIDNFSAPLYFGGKVDENWKNLENL